MMSRQVKGQDMLCLHLHLCLTHSTIYIIYIDSVLMCGEPHPGCQSQRSWSTSFKVKTSILYLQHPLTNKIDYMDSKQKAVPLSLRAVPWWPSSRLFNHISKTIYRIDPKLNILPLCEWASWCTVKVKGQCHPRSKVKSTSPHLKKYKWLYRLQTESISFVSTRW